MWCHKPENPPSLNMMKCDVTNQLHIRHSLSSSTAEENQYNPPNFLFSNNWITSLCDVTMTHLVNNIRVVCLHSKTKRASVWYFLFKTGNIMSYCPQILQSDWLKLTWGIIISVRWGLCFYVWLLIFHINNFIYFFSCNCTNIRMNKDTYNMLTLFAKTFCLPLTGFMLYHVQQMSHC